MLLVQYKPPPLADRAPKQCTDAVACLIAISGLAPGRAEISVDLLTRRTSSVIGVKFLSYSLAYR